MGGGGGGGTQIPEQTIQDALNAGSDFTLNENEFVLFEQPLNVPEGQTLTNNGDIILLNNDIILNASNLVNNGIIRNSNETPDTSTIDRSIDRNESSISEGTIRAIVAIAAAVAEISDTSESELPPVYTEGPGELIINTTSSITLLQAQDSRVKCNVFFDNLNMNSLILKGTASFTLEGKDTLSSGIRVFNLGVLDISQSQNSSLTLVNIELKLPNISTLTIPSGFTLEFSGFSAINSLSLVNNGAVRVNQGAVIDFHSNNITLENNSIVEIIGQLTLSNTTNNGNFLISSTESSNYSVICEGEFVNNDGSYLENRGSLVINGTLLLNENSVFSNIDIITVSSSGFFNDQNNVELLNEGNFTLEQGGRFTKNSGIFNNHGIVNIGNLFEITENMTFTNNADLNIVDNGNLINNGLIQTIDNSAIINSGRIENNNNITILDEFTNHGELINSGIFNLGTSSIQKNIYFYNRPDGTVTNNGRFIVTKSNETAENADFTNQGILSITELGELEVTGSIRNNQNGIIENEGTVNINSLDMQFSTDAQIINKGEFGIELSNFNQDALYFDGKLINGNEDSSNNENITFTIGLGSNNNSQLQINIKNSNTNYGTFNINGINVVFSGGELVNYNIFNYEQSSNLNNRLSFSNCNITNEGALNFDVNELSFSTQTIINNEEEALLRISENTTATLHTISIANEGTIINEGNLHTKDYTPEITNNGFLHNRKGTITLNSNLVNNGTINNEGEIVVNNAIKSNFFGKILMSGSSNDPNSVEGHIELKRQILNQQFSFTGYSTLFLTSPQSRLEWNENFINQNPGSDPGSDIEVPFKMKRLDIDPTNPRFDMEFLEGTVKFYNFEQEQLVNLPQGDPTILPNGFRIYPLSENPGFEEIWCKMTVGGQTNEIGFLNL